jgi:hypothetical protein
MRDFLRMQQLCKGHRGLKKHIYTLKGKMGLLKQNGTF